MHACCVLNKVIACIVSCSVARHMWHVLLCTLQVAQATLTSLLDAEMSGICDTAEAAVTSNLQEKDCETSPMHIIADFRKDIVRVLGLHLNREQPETRRTKKKKAHRKKSKRKRTLQS